MTAVVWLSRDLRLRDHPALFHVVGVSDAVVPVFIWCPEEESPWEPGSAR